MTDTLQGVPEISARHYEELAVGDTFGPFSEPLAPGVADALRGPVGEARPGEGAPLGVLPMVTLRVLRRALDGIIPGGVLLRQRFVVHAAIPADAVLEVDVAVSAMQRRRERLETTFAFACRCDGILAAVVEWTIIAP